MLTATFTTPLVGTPYFISQGLIKVVDRFNRQFNVGEICFERYDEQNFQYVIKPYWNEIEFIPSGVFNGIPGINMELKREKYYRVNMTPSLISMRTPSESREDVRELMNSVGLDYYDRFEWLLRSNSRCGDDNIVILRKENAREITIGKIQNDNISIDDIVKIDNLGNICSTNGHIIDKTFTLLQSGAKIYISDEKRFLKEDERKSMLYLLMNMLISYDRNNRESRLNGIRSAKEQGNYLGRKPIKVDSVLLQQVVYLFRNNQISEKDAMNKLNISSRSTFYRKIKNK